MFDTVSLERIKPVQKGMIGLEALPREQYHLLIQSILSKSSETTKETTMLEHACGMSERILSAVLLRHLN